MCSEEGETKIFISVMNKNHSLQESSIAELFPFQSKHNYIFRILSIYVIMSRKAIKYPTDNLLCSTQQLMNIEEEIILKIYII